MIEHEIFRRSELLVQNMIEVIDHPAYDKSARTAVSGSLCQMSIEHSCAFRMLAENGMLASCFVTLRAQFEAIVRSIWALYSANDDRIARLAAQLSTQTEQAAKGLPQVLEMLSALASSPKAEVPLRTLTEFKDSCWKALNSFVHAGLHPLSRHQSGYPLELIVGSVKASNALAMLGAMQFCILTGIPGLQRELSPLHERFRDCLPLRSDSVE